MAEPPNEIASVPSTTKTIIFAGSLKLLRGDFGMGTYKNDGYGREFESRSLDYQLQKVAGSGLEGSGFRAL